MLRLQLLHLYEVMCTLIEITYIFFLFNFFLWMYKVALSSIIYFPRKLNWVFKSEDLLDSVKHLELQYYMDVIVASVHTVYAVAVMLPITCLVVLQHTICGIYTSLFLF